MNPLPSPASIRPGPQRADELEQQVVGVDRLDAVAQELRVEPDLERFAGERHRHASRSPRRRPGVCADTVSSPSANRMPQRRVLLREQADAPHDVGELARLEAQLVLVRVGQQLAVVRELTFDEARGEDHPADLEHDLVRVAGRAQRVGVGGLRDPRELLQGPGRHVRLERTVERRLERGLLHRQAVRVGGDHPQLLAGGGDEDAGEDRAGLVAGGRAGDLADRGDERLGRHRHDGVAAGVGERREVLGAERADVERRRAGDDLDVLLGGAELERHLVGRERADDVEGQSRGDHGGAGALDLRLERDAQTDLHVRGAQLDATVLGDQLHTREGLDGRAGGSDTRDGLELREQLGRGSLELHDGHLSEEEVIGAVDVCMTARSAGVCGRDTHMSRRSLSVAPVGTETAGHRP